MTLEEAIMHAEEMADRCAVTDGNIKCETEYRQLAEWLKELLKKRMMFEERADIIRNDIAAQIPMEPEEAIERIKEHIAIHQYNEPRAIRISKALQMGIEALEKQIPKKPILINKNKEFDGNWKKVCPLCGRILIERITTPEESFPVYHNYTCHCLCGQAIDWNDVTDIEGCCNKFERENKE